MLESIKKVLMFILRFIWLIFFLIVFGMAYLVVALRFGHKFSSGFLDWILLYFDETVKGVFR